MDQVATLLQLEAAIGVSNASQMEDLVVNQSLIAGIEFHHPDVSYTVGLKDHSERRRTASPKPKNVLTFQAI